MQRAQPPQHFLVPIHDDIFDVHPGLAEFVDGFSQVPVVGDFVPEIGRPGAVADEHDGPFLRVGELFEDIQPPAGGVHQEDIVVPFGDLAGLFLGFDRRHRPHLERKIGGARHLLQLGLDPVLFFRSLGIGMDAAPVAPTGGLATLRRLVNQHRLNLEREPAWPGAVGAGSRAGGADREAGEHQRAHRGGAHPGQEMAPGQTLVLRVSETSGAAAAAAGRVWM